MASSSSSSFGGQAPSRSRDERVEWLIAVMRKGVPIVYNIELHSRTTGTTAMHAVGKAYRETNPSVPWYHSRPHLEDAIISPCTVNADTEAQDYPRVVILKSSEPLPELTKAFHNPSLLNGTGVSLILANPGLNVTAGKNPIDGHYHAILIKTEANHWLTAIGIAGAVMVSAVIGYLVGYFSGNPELGVAAGAAFVAVLSFIQVCIFFLK